MEWYVLPFKAWGCKGSSTAKNFYYMWDESNAGGQTALGLLRRLWMVNSEPDHFTENAKQHVRSRPERHSLGSARPRCRRTAQVRVVGVDTFCLFSSLELFPGPDIGLSTSKYNVLGSITWPHLKEAVVFFSFIPKLISRWLCWSHNGRAFCPVAKVSRFTGSGPPSI